MVEWLIGKGDTSFTFSLLTFSWSRPNKGKYSVANLACWLWKTNESISTLDKHETLRQSENAETHRSEASSYLGGVAVIKRVLHHQVL